MASIWALWCCCCCRIATKVPTKSLGTAYAFHRNSTNRYSSCWLRWSMANCRRIVMWSMSLSFSDLMLRPLFCFLTPLLCNSVCRTESLCQPFHVSPVKPKDILIIIHPKRGNTGHSVRTRCSATMKNFGVYLRISPVQFLLELGHFFRSLLEPNQKVWSLNLWLLCDTERIVSFFCGKFRRFFQHKRRQKRLPLFGSPHGCSQLQTS